MPAIITNKFRIHNAEQFVESFSEATPTVYYLGIGRPQAFGTLTRGDGRTENQGSDAAPLTPVDSVQDEFNYGPQEQFTIFIDTITEIELQIQLALKQQTVEQLHYGTLRFMLFQVRLTYISV
jgi:hypothetical protein